MLRIPHKLRHRNMSKAKGPGPGPEHGPLGRITRLREIVTELVRNERVEGNAQYMDEARGYMERVKHKYFTRKEIGRLVVMVVEDEKDRFLWKASDVTSFEVPGWFSEGQMGNLVQIAHKHGPQHTHTMEMADYWLMEKDLIHKLFKVLVPRYENNHLGRCTAFHRLPYQYPGPSKPLAILELINNPYPPVVPHKTILSGSLLNVLLKEASKDFHQEKKMRLSVGSNQETPQHTPDDTHTEDLLPSAPTEQTPKGNTTTL